MPPGERGNDRPCPGCVLLIEDEPDSRESLRGLLRLLGYRVEVAANGVSGVRQGLALRPDVVLIDLGLPDLDGFEVARQLRAGLGSRVLLVAHTGYGHPESREQGQRAGFDAYLVKPFDLDELLHLLPRRAAGPTSS
jgi:two-component system CheB/CheR fusion protein